MSDLKHHFRAKCSCSPFLILEKQLLQMSMHEEIELSASSISTPISTSLRIRHLLSLQEFMNSFDSNFSFFYKHLQIHFFSVVSMSLPEAERVCFPDSAVHAELFECSEMNVFNMFVKMPK